MAGIVQIMVDIKHHNAIRNFITTLGTNLIPLIEAIYQSSSYYSNENLNSNLKDDINQFGENLRDSNKKFNDTDQFNE